MKLPVLRLTVFWKWFWFVMAATAANGPKLTELALTTKLPNVVHWTSFVVSLATLLLALQIHPTPTVPVPNAKRPTPPPLALLVLAFALAGCTPSEVAQVQTALSKGLVLAGDVCQLVALGTPARHGK